MEKLNGICPMDQITFCPKGQNGLQLMGIDYNKPFFMIIAGRSGVGKSVLLRYIMREMNIHHKFDYIVVFSNTAFEGSFDYVDKKYIHEEFNEEIIKNIIKLQKQLISKNIKKNCAIILDDCCGSDELQSSIMKKLAIQARHYNIYTLVTSQYINLVCPTIRANSNYSCFFDIGNGVREMRSIYEAYGQKFKNYDEFKDFYYTNTGDYKFIMWNNNDNMYKVFRCPENIPKFKITINKKY